MLILSCQKWMVNYFKQKSFFAAKECISCATVFGKPNKKDNKLSFYPYKPDSAKDNIYRSVQKSWEKEWADKIISFVFLFLFFHCQFMFFFLFIGLDCYKAGTKLDKSECLKANGQENVPAQFERCTIACKR